MLRNLVRLQYVVTLLLDWFRSATQYLSLASFQSYFLSGLGFSSIVREWFMFRCVEILKLFCCFLSLNPDIGHLLVRSQETKVKLQAATFNKVFDLELYIKYKKRLNHCKAVYVGPYSFLA